MVFIKRFTKFHVHTDSSNTNGFYDSVTNYKQYIDKAKDCSMDAIGFSEHGNINDWIKKKQYCDKKGIKYIHGVELYLTYTFEDLLKGYHIGLYAKNYEGVKEINKIVSNATLKSKGENSNGSPFYYNPRISIEQLENTSDNIIVTTACLASMLWRPHFTNKSISADEKRIQEEKWVEYRERYIAFLSKNKHRCFLEVQYHNCQDQIDYNKILLEISKKYNIPIIAGTDTHSIDKYHAECRLILQKAQSNRKGGKETSMDVAYEDTFDLTFKTYDELVEMFSKQGVLTNDEILLAIENTNVLNDMVEHFEFDYSFKYPQIYKDPRLEFKKTIHSKLQDKVNRGIIPKDKLSVYKNRIKEEYDAMCKQGMESVMVFLSEMMDYCDENNIIRGDRGSVVGSLIAFVLDIIETDPIEWNTIFSRFVNKDRVSLADIDIDFASEDREIIYNYIIERHGGIHARKACYISQWSTLKDRGSIDVIARGLGYDDLQKVAEIKDEFDTIFEQYTKTINENINMEEFEPIEARSVDFEYNQYYKAVISSESAKMTLDKCLSDFNILKQNNQDLFYYIDGIKGTIVAKGVHPAGMVGAPITLDDNVGIWFKDGDESVPVLQCDMVAIDSLNYTKFDILGLKTLGIIKDTYKYINQQHKRSYQIDYTDENVWNEMLLSRVGVFQFEKASSFKMLQTFLPKKINDMSLINAAIRPSGKSYRDSLVLRQAHPTPSEEIDELLKDNYSYLVFQEDTIKFLTDICGLPGSTADSIRRCIAKQKHDEYQQYLPMIINGYCDNSDKPRHIAEEEVKEFLEIIKDSISYQFGYNHSTAYSKNGFHTTMLRHYYPLEFTTAYLNRADKEEHLIMGHELAKIKNITINPVRFRFSRDKYTFHRESNSIYQGIESIKYMNKSISDELWLLRENNYENFYDLMVDIKTKTSINARQMRILTILDFFVEFGKNGKLIEYTEIFNTLYGKTNFSKLKVEDLGLPHKLFADNCQKNNPKTYTKIDYEAILRALFNETPDKTIPLAEQISEEVEHLGSPIYQNDNIPEDIYAVVEMKIYQNKLKPYVDLYSLKNGEIIRAKVTNAEDFSLTPFGKYDIIRVQQFNINNNNKVTHTIVRWDRIGG